MESRKRVLVVDDDRRLLIMLAILLDGEYEVETAADGEEGLSALGDFTPDLIVLDLEMPGMNGRNFFSELRGRGLQTPVLILSAFGAEAARHELGAQEHINKPFDPTSLLVSVGRLLAGS